MRGRAVVATLLAAVVGSVIVVAAAPRPAAAATSATSAYVPVAPCRVADSRASGGRNQSMTVAMAGACGVSADATAVVVTLTVVNPAAAGYLSAFPAGAELPTASNVNYLARTTVANTAVVRLGGGAVSLFSNVPTDKVVDVVGAFVPAESARSGRYVAVTPARLLDTRATAKVAAGEVAVAPVTGVPADAAAVAVNLTFTEATQPGYFTAYGDGPLPAVSTGNVDSAGQTRAVFTVVPTATAVRVFSQSGAHVLVDLVGYFTGPSADLGRDGLFAPAVAARVLDTRATATSRLTAGRSTSVAVPKGAAAWVNLTAVDATAPGYFTVWADGTPLPPTSTVNATAARQTVANAAITRIADRGVAVFAQNGGDVVVDVAGVFVGPPLVTIVPPTPAADEVIGRSVLGRDLVATHVVVHPGAVHKVLVLGFMHGDEQAGREIVTALRYAPVPTAVDLWLMDTMNPDGAAARTRVNGRGVDLNRNFTGGSFPWCPAPGCGVGAFAVDTGPGPMSEPEAVAFLAFIQREHFDLIVSYHQPLVTVDCSPYRGPKLTGICQAYAAASGVPYNRNGYIDISGTMTNTYMEANPGKWAFTMELPLGEATDVSRHVAAVWAAAAAL